LLTPKQERALTELLDTLRVSARLKVKDITFAMEELKDSRIALAHPNLAGKDLLGHAKHLSPGIGRTVERLIRFMASQGIGNVSVEARS
jgi:hypothetical protein